ASSPNLRFSSGNPPTTQPPQGRNQRQRTATVSAKATVCDPCAVSPARSTTREATSRQRTAVGRRLAFGSLAEAAAAIGVGRTFFYRHVLPEIRVVRRGRKTIVPRRELERWLDMNATDMLGSTAWHRE